MIFRQITDWDDAYANGSNIPEGASWPGRWVEPAQAMRDSLNSVGAAQLNLAYGSRSRNRFDLFTPSRAVAGLVVFVHGGFWKALDNSYWSQLAAGPLAHGYAVAIPSYTLCPDIRIAGIVAEVAAAIESAAQRIVGPIHLTGHSAGGHLVSRMVSANSPLTAQTRARLGNVVSISGLHDLRPLLATSMNETLCLDAAEAQAESPALLEPLPNVALTAWVGGSERAEFLRQSALLANIWSGLGVPTALVVEPDRHHFNIINGLADPDHPLNAALLA